MLAVTTSNTVHTIIARCIIDPDFLHGIETDAPTALAPYGLSVTEISEFAAMNAQRLSEYAGLIAAVQNNGIWQHLPATRWILKHHGLDLKVFVAYRKQHQSHRRERSGVPGHYTVAFMDFLDGLIARETEFAKTDLQDVFRHERILWDVMRQPHTAAAGPAVQAGGAGKLSSASVLQIQGTLRIAHYQANPRLVADALRAGQYAGPPQGEATLGYWRDGEGGTLRIFDLDPDSAVLLSAIDGVCSVAALLRKCDCTAPDRSRAALGLLRECLAMGILTAKPVEATGRAS